MTPGDHEAQALSFLAWHRKRGGDLEDDFGAWSRSKDLRHRDHVAIRRIVLAEIAAHGSVPAVEWPLDGPGAA